MMGFILRRLAQLLPVDADDPYDAILAWDLLNYLDKPLFAALAAQPFELGEDLARRAHSGRVRAFNAHPGIARGDLRLRAGGDDSQAAEIVPDELLQKLRGLVSEGLDGHLLDQ